MDSAHADQELIQKRVAVYEAAWKNCSVEDLVALMADDVSISDFGVGVLDLNKTAAHAFFTKIFACSDNLNITTRSVNGHKNFTAWEMEATFNYVKPMEEVAHEEVFAPAMADGRSMCMVGVTLLWWNNDGKIVKIHDYSKTVAK